MQERRTIHDLSFMQLGTWCPVRTGDIELDNAHGRACAEEMLNFIVDTENPTILGAVCRAMIEGATYGPVESGFCLRIGVTILVNGAR